MVVAALALLVSCQPDTPESTPTTFTIDFEQATLNAEGVTYGISTDSKDPTNVYDIYTYSQNGASFDTWMQTEPYFIWWGWVVSNNIGTEYKSDYSHQYDCPIAAASGNNFAVCYFSDYNKGQYLPSVRFDGAVTPQSMLYTNSTTLMLYATGADAYSQWDDNDQMGVVVRGYLNGKLTREVGFDMAVGANIVDTWREADLTQMGKVDRLEFIIVTSDVGDWGINAPTYLCIDDIKYTK